MIAVGETVGDETVGDSPLERLDTGVELAVEEEEELR